jgi:hypothetical protein
VRDRRNGRRCWFDVSFKPRRRNTENSFERLAESGIGIVPNALSVADRVSSNPIRRFESNANRAWNVACYWFAGEFRTLQNDGRFLKIQARVT